MNKRTSIFLALSMSMPSAWASDISITATAHSVLFRGSLPAVSQPAAGSSRHEVAPPQRRIYVPNPRRFQYERGRPSAALPEAPPPPLRLVNSRTGGEVALGRYDRSIEGYFFSLPMTADLSRGDVCLVLKLADGRSVPVREESNDDDGYAFRNPLWERELLRQSDLAVMRADMGQARQQMDAARAELSGLEGANGSALGAEAPRACTLGPEVAAPLASAAAVSPEQARLQAPGVCANKWRSQSSMKPEHVARLYRDAGMQADLADFDSAEDMASAMPQLRIRLESQDSGLLQEAAEQGPKALQHASGVARFKQLTQLCKNDVITEVQRAVAAWEQDKQAALNAPLSSKLECERKAVRVVELQRRLQAGDRYAIALQQRISELDSSRPSATEKVDAAPIACKEN